MKIELVQTDFDLMKQIYLAKYFNKKNKKVLDRLILIIDELEHHLNVNTNIDLLLEAKQDGISEYTVMLNEDMKKTFLQRRYILISTYNKIWRSQIIQDHQIFPHDNIYTLYSGYKEKELKLVPSFLI